MWTKGARFGRKCQFWFLVLKGVWELVCKAWCLGMTLGIASSHFWGTHNPSRVNSEFYTGYRSDTTSFSPVFTLWVAHSSPYFWWELLLWWCWWGWLRLGRDFYRRYWVVRDIMNISVVDTISFSPVGCHGLALACFSRKRMPFFAKNFAVFFRFFRNFFSFFSRTFRAFRIFAHFRYPQVAASLKK